nr:unnamed protein product [Naegleria fowleri]
MIIELVFGIYNNSLGLISDSAHMFFDCTALVIGLYGSIMSKWKSNQIYSYGYVRYEYLSGFINGILLVFISIYILLESIHRLIDPPIVHTQQLLLVSVMGFAVNMYGVIFYHQDHYGCNGHSHNSSHCSSYSHNNSSTTTLHEESSSCENEMNHNERQTMNSSSPSSTTTHSEQHFECSHHHHDENLYGVYLHMIADALGSIGVITSTLIVQYLGWYIADPICSLIISVMILYTSIPLITNSSRVLLQRTPIQHEHKINECVKEVLQLEGVVQVRNLHFWVLKSNLNVGSCKVLISNQSNEQTILKQVTNIFRNYRCNLDMTIEVEKDPLQVMAHSEHSHHE